MIRTIMKVVLTGLIAWFFVSCSVISSDVKNEAIPPVPLPAMVKDIEQYVGKTVVVGGYILKTENKPEETVIIVLQTPLYYWDEPKKKDSSQGRILIHHTGFLDPEKYGKDRRITVAGTVTGIVTRKIGETPFTYLEVQSKEIYLWSEIDYDTYPYYRYPYYYDPWWWGPPYYHRFPYYHPFYRW